MTPSSKILNNPSLAFVGGGNMATSIIGGLIQSGRPAESIKVADPSEERQQLLLNEFGVTCSENNRAAIETADIILLAVKPQMMRIVLEDLSSLLQQSKPLIISIAAGIRIKDALRWIGSDLPFIRVMPNTPALVNMGASGLYANQLATETHKAHTAEVMQSVGKVIWVKNEQLIDSVTGVSGSGPAYFFRLMELMIEEAENNGLTTEEARCLVLQTALGAASLAMQSEYSAGELRRQVTSPNGTTQAGLEFMEKHHIKETVRGSVKAAILRSVELSDQLGEE